MFIFFFYLFTILEHLTTTQAVKQDGNFKIDLIHRYSQQSPFYNSSMSSLERFQRLALDSKSRLDQIKWLQNDELNSNIISNSGDYLMIFYVGNPPVQVVAVIDTSTDLTWFQCTPCMNCYRQAVPLFNPQKSTTYQMEPCDSRYCSTLDTTYLSCDEGTSECLYWYSFGNHTSMTRGILGNDTYTFTSTDRQQSSFPSIVFGCGFDQEGPFDPRSSGVAGLGNGPLSLISQLGNQIDYKFSYCFTSATLNTTSKLRLGPYETPRPGCGPEPRPVTTPFIPTYPSNFYNLELDGISIGQSRIQVENDIIIDTATTLTYITPSIFSSLEALVTAAMRKKPMANSVNESVLCYTIISGRLIPPDIVFHFTSGDLVLKGSNVFFEYRGALCLSIVPTPEENDPMIFGNMAQVNLEVQYDLLSKTVSFAQKDCALDY